MFSGERVCLPGIECVFLWHLLVSHQKKKQKPCAALRGRFISGRSRGRQQSPIPTATTWLSPCTRKSFSEFNRQSRNFQHSRLLVTIFGMLPSGAKTLARSSHDMMPCGAKRQSWTQRSLRPPYHMYPKTGASIKVDATM